MIIKKAQAKLLNRVLASADSVEIEDVSDLEKATSIVEKLHKIERLEDGKSTENIDIQASGYTLREVMEQHHSDDIILESETLEIEETE